MSVSSEGIFQKIRQTAKREGRDVGSLVTLYVIERFVARLNIVDPDGFMTVKGGQSIGMMFGVTGRPTKDLDINISVPEGEDGVAWSERLVRAACLLEMDDGVSLNVSGSTFEARDHQGTGGLRVDIAASVHSCRAPFIIDVGVNNEMSFDPTRLMVGGVLHAEKAPPAPLNVRLYPFENTIAEKIVSKIEDGYANIRHKDFYDLWFSFEALKRAGSFRILTANAGEMSTEEAQLARQVKSSISAGSLLSLEEREIDETAYDRIAYAISRTAPSRGTALPDDLIGFFRTSFGDDEAQSSQWSNWARNNRKRLLYQPAGTEPGAAKETALHVLIDEIAPFLSAIDARLNVDRVFKNGGVYGIPG